MAKDWDPGSYARFRELRLRPALDLLMQAGSPGPGDIIDLGCGDGAAAASLRARYPKRRLLGVDASAAMLAKARGYDALIEADIAGWAPESPPGLISSNAALHWLPDHALLLPRLAGLLAPGGTLAVQMPRQFAAPSHQLIRDLAAELFPERFDFDGWEAPVAEPAVYQRLLAPLGEVNLWETEYLQRLAPVPEGHPVQAFTASTALRPVAERLDTGELTRFTKAYDAALEAAYPREADGGVLFPFRRLFFVLRRAA
ncbi:methyltransferase domain-containing protein [Pseudoroseicyclus sp. CXY001]|uniref:methyltransferase domain-containing protein n=1 Tax=Pseudoroseicyclus sp. CXY001 TaxID=3242492 RepID=UPI003570BB7F